MTVRDCIKICALTVPLTDIDSHLAEMCLGKNNNYILTEKNVVVTKALSLIEKSKGEITRLIQRNKELLKEKCPHCQKLYKISASFGFEPKKKTCPEQYLKTHYYKESTRKDMKKGVCDTGEVLNYLESYATFLVTKNKKYIPKGMGLSDQKAMESNSRELWEACPAKCSFLTSYVTTIDPEECSGNVDVKVSCTHKVETEWFKPIYDIKIDYKPDLKCKEKDPV